jgi:phosphoglycerol transferase MdoB-like AlkP superfamily enzyme
MQTIVENRGFEVAEDAGDIGGNVNSSFGVDEPATVSRMLSWIDGLRRDEPFFLMYLPIAGHHPYETPEPRPFPERDEINRYHNALFFGDAALGVFFAELKKRALFEKTLFVVFGDHGEAFGQHEGNYGHTMFLYEENVRVPYLFALPGIVSEQTRIRRIASVIDTAPTILDLLGIPLPTIYQGSSLLDGADRMALLFTDYSSVFLGLRDGPWKFIDEVGADRAKLFRLDQDRSGAKCRRDISCARRRIQATPHEMEPRTERADSQLELGVC